MLDALVSGISVVTNRSANALDFICGNTDTDTAATNQNAAVRFTGDDFASDGFGEVRVVAA